MDQKSGLVGPEAMPNQQGKGNQVAAGMDLSLGPQGGQPKETGDGWWKEKEARLEEAGRNGNLDRHLERQQESKSAKGTIPGKTRQGTRLEADGQTENIRKDNPSQKRKWLKER